MTTTRARESGVTSAALHASANAACAIGNVRVLAEALFPDVRRGLAGKAPPVEELQRRGTPPEHSGLIGRTVGRERERDRTVAAVALVGSPGSAGADVRTGRRASARSRRPPSRTAPAPDRAAPPKSYAPTVGVEAERGVDRGRVRLLEVRRTGSGEQQTARRERRGETRRARCARPRHPASWSPRRRPRPSASRAQAASRVPRRSRRARAGAPGDRRPRRRVPSPPPSRPGPRTQAGPRLEK